MDTMDTHSTNSELDLAWQLVERTGVNVFLTGKAGTGKTTFLRRLRERSPKRMVVVAPTGVVDDIRIPSNVCNFKKLGRRQPSRAGHFM